MPSCTAHAGLRQPSQTLLLQRHATATPITKVGCGYSELKSGDKPLAWHTCEIFYDMDHAERSITLMGFISESPKAYILNV